jgi:hypothetical protein
VSLLLVVVVCIIVIIIGHRIDISDQRLLADLSRECLACLHLPRADEVTRLQGSSPTKQVLRASRICHAPGAPRIALRQSLRTCISQSKH